MARRKPEDWIFHVGSELQRLGDEMVRLAPGMLSHRLWEPRVDVHETPFEVVVRCEAAGMRGEDLAVSYSEERNALILKGRRREEDANMDERTSCHQLEIFYGEFEREVPMPSVELDVEQTHAIYRNGMLLVSIPKKVTVLGRRTVVVRRT